jgi:DnaK suppressor protein
MKKAEIKNMLLKMREDTLKKIASNMKMEIGHVQEALSDMYDQADDERDRQFTILLCDRDRETLSQIDDALERLEDGEYGLCEECGEKISKARLSVRPFARYCVPCKSKLEKNERYLRGQSEEGVRYRTAIRGPEEVEE